MKSRTGKITKIFNIMRHNGLGLCLFRTQYILRKKSGLLKRKFPVRLWSEIALTDFLKQPSDSLPESFLQNHKTNNRHFFFENSELPKPDERYKEKVLSQADKILHNRFCYFFDRFHDLGQGPDWFLNPVTNVRAANRLHWTDVKIFDPDVGDIKFIWEPSRFAWVYVLVRAFAATGDNKYAEKFWSLFESWLKANQPNMGPNYVCGQECSIRLMAMCFALYAFGNAASSTNERKIKLITAIVVHADRIYKNIDFAISTRTNHSLTEAAGIYTVGLLFPEFRHSELWLKRGKKILTEEGLKQICPDGSYIQHSMNYHRLMLQDFLWVLRLAELNNDEFCDELILRVTKVVEFLYQIQDDKDGRVPNYGANDGALILPLNDCDYLDYRPVIQSCWYLLNQEKLYENGPWDEDMLWLFGPDSIKAPAASVKKMSTQFPIGGYYTLRNKESWAMTRCHTFKNRPGHADMLTVDLWYKGINVLHDSGSFQYNCDPLWQKHFSSTSAHNTVVVDGLDQMTRGTRFMWFDWTKSKTVLFKSFQDNQIKLFQGEHYGYRRDGLNVIHQRAILSANDSWVIVDDIVGNGEHDIELLWHLADCENDVQGNSVTLKTDQGPVSLSVMSPDKSMKCRCLKGDENIPAGWDSLYYGQRKPSPVFIVSVKASQLPLRVITLVCTGNVPEQAKHNEANSLSWLSRDSNQECKVLLNSIEQSSNSIFNSYQVASGKVVF